MADKLPMALMLVIVVFSQVRAAAPAKCDPISRYDVRDVEGWTVHVNKAQLEGQARADQMLKGLQALLLQIGRVVPKGELANPIRVASPRGMVRGYSAPW